MVDIAKLDCDISSSLANCACFSNLPNLILLVLQCHFSKHYFLLVGTN